MRLRFSSFLLLLGSVGCSQSVEDRLEQLDDLQVEVGESVCGCSAEFYSQSEVECLAAFGETETRRDCLVVAYELSPDASEAYLDCLILAHEELSSCAEEQIDCDEVTSWNTCLTRFEDAADVCPRLPESTSEAVARCSGDENNELGSITSIGNASFNSQTTRIVTLNDQLVEALCECATEMGFSSTSSCLEATSSTEAPNGCTNESSVTREYLDCTEESLRGAISCFAENPNCGSELFRCVSDFASACPEGPGVCAG